VSHGLFRQLCHGLQIMPQFAEIVSAFGARTTDDDEYFTTCHRQKTWGAQNDSTGTFRHSGETPSAMYAMAPEPPRSLTCIDICYNIRFVERHERDGLKDPWSFRQVAVYHSYDYERKKCSWVFIQLPKAVKASIVREAKPHSPLLIHWLIRHYCASEWRWYINYLSDLVSTMVSMLHNNYAIITQLRIRGTSPVSLASTKTWKAYHLTSSKVRSSRFCAIRSDVCICCSDHASQLPSR